MAILFLNVALSLRYVERYTAGEWDVEIPLIISNHEDMRPVADRFDTPLLFFHYKGEQRRTKKGVGFIKK